MMGHTERRDDCRFEQTWYAGDVHFNERIELRADWTGTWIQGGMASDAPHDQKEFTWSRTASTLTVSYGDQQRTIEYRIERPRSTCYLKFGAHPFLSDDPGYLTFSNRP